MLETTDIERWLREHTGVLVARSATVCRNTYFGNNIIAQNDSLDHVDSRGYVPVELWIMSMVEAENTIRVAGEGLTKIDIHGEKITLAELEKICGHLIFGPHAKDWPLTKILDIGGTPKETSFGTVEIPPIPVHVHPRKTEAYFFPPTNLPPYNRDTAPTVTTRIGLKKDVTKDEFKKRLVRFGKDDSMFELMNEFVIEPMTGWTVLEKTLHAPGPYVTFEIQRPADDYNNASWRLGERLGGQEYEDKYQEHVLRDVRDGDEFIEKALDWGHTTDQGLHDKYFHTPLELEWGSWGRRYKIFFDMFYGEGWEVAPGSTATFTAKKIPQAGIVWSGEGTLNDNALRVDGNNEFLLTPNNPAVVKNTGSTTLFIFTVEPIRTAR